MGNNQSALVDCWSPQKSVPRLCCANHHPSYRRFTRLSIPPADHPRSTRSGGPARTQPHLQTRSCSLSPGDYDCDAYPGNVSCQEDAKVYAAPRTELRDRSGEAAGVAVAAENGHACVYFHRDPARLAGVLEPYEPGADNVVGNHGTVIIVTVRSWPSLLALWWWRWLLWWW